MHFKRFFEQILGIELLNTVNRGFRAMSTQKQIRTSWALNPQFSKFGALVRLHGTQKPSLKLNKLWVSGHVHVKASLSKFGFKPTIFRVWGSRSLFEPLFQIPDFAPRCSWLFAHPSGVSCWFS